MAIDDALLERSGNAGQVLLRLYSWSVPTLSLGYFQKCEDRHSHCESTDLPLVRRATGGGAIVHHQEITYSLAIPQTVNDLGAAPEIYDTVHSSIVSWLGKLGLVASQWTETIALKRHASQIESKPTEPSFLCFQRRSSGDVVASGFKVLGSAQRRSKLAVLQHGSLLFFRSPKAPQLPGVGDLIQLGVQPSCSDSLDWLYADRDGQPSLAESVRTCIAGAVGNKMSLAFQDDPGLGPTLAEGCSLALEKYRSSEWTNRL